MHQKYLIANELRFDPLAKTLTNIKTNIVVDIHTPAANCLLTLILNRGKTVSQSELYRAGWGEKGEVSTTTATYYQCFVNLRKQIKNTGYDKDILRTIQKQGVQLDCSVIKLESDYCENYNATLSSLKIKHNPKKLTVFYATLMLIIIFLVSVSVIVLAIPSHKEYMSDTFFKVAGLPDCMRVKSVVLLPIEEIKARVNRMKLSCTLSTPVFISAGFGRTTIFTCNKELTTCQSRTELMTHD